MDINNVTNYIHDPEQDSFNKGPNTPLVSHVILAEFDILRGPSLTYQYPTDTGADPLQLAELMLPDGSHLRKEDWVLLILNQRATAKFNASYSERESIFGKKINGSIAWVQSYFYSYSTCDWSPLSSEAIFQLAVFGSGALSVWSQKMEYRFIEIDISQASFYAPEPNYIIIFDSHITLGLVLYSEKEEALLLNYLLKHCSLDNFHLWGRSYPACLPLQNSKKPLLYLLNLVQTKHMSGIQRGARVKAMAIISRHKWIHVFKPLLILALDEYFKGPSIKVLQNIYKSINSIDISYIPILTTSEKYILKFFPNTNLLKNKFDLITKYISEHIDRIRQEKVYRDVVKKLSKDTDAENIQLPPGSEKSKKQVMPNIKDGRYFETRVLYELINVPIRIPLTLYPEEFPEFSVSKILQTFGSGTSLTNTNGSSHSSKVGSKGKGGGSYYWHPHLDSGANTAPLMIITNAILSNKRVVFLGDKRPAGEVAEYVLSAGYIASAGGMTIPGITERLFPYMGLSNVDYMFSISGYVAGVTNPVFEEQTGWWDVLCNISTGKVVVNRQLSVNATNLSVSVPPGLSTGDTQSQISSALMSPSSTKLQSATSDIVVESHHNDTSTNNSAAMDTCSLCFSYYINEEALISDVLAGLNEHIHENTLRNRLELYLKSFLLAVAAYELIVFGKTSIALRYGDFEHPEWGPNIPPLVDEISRTRADLILPLKSRIEGLRESNNYLYYKKEFESFSQNRLIKDVDVEQIIVILSGGLQTTDDELLIKLFMCLCDVLSDASEDQIHEFLQHLCYKSRCLLPISYGLFHYRWEVRYSVTKILCKINSFHTGAEIIKSFNPFIKLKLDQCIEIFETFPTDPLYHEIPLTQEPQVYKSAPHSQHCPHSPVPASASDESKRSSPPLDITKALNAIDIPGDKLHMTYYIDTRNIAEITLSRLLSEAGSTSADDNTMKSPPIRGSVSTSFPREEHNSGSNAESPTYKHSSLQSSQHKMNLVAPERVESLKKDFVVDVDKLDNEE